MGGLPGEILDVYSKQDVRDKDKHQWIIEECFPEMPLKKAVESSLRTAAGTFVTGQGEHGTFREKTVLSRIEMRVHIYTDRHRDHQQKADDCFLFLRHLN